MPDEVDFRFHAGRLLENPAWKRALGDMRARLDRERDSLDWDDERRQYVSIAMTLLAKLERHVTQMAEPDNVAAFHRQQATKVV